MIIAIDGPAGSGKSTIAKIISKKKGYIFFDTGSLYRIYTYLFLSNKVNINIDEEIEREIKKYKKYSFEFIEGKYLFGTNNNMIDYTNIIRENDINENVSFVAKHLIVRNEVNRILNNMSNKGNYIFDGRDIGTVVFPNAEYKFFMTASSHNRGERRYKQNIELGIESNLEDIIKNIEMRDKNDENRDIDPLKKSEDAIVINTDNKSIEDVVKEVIGILNK